MILRLGGKWIGMGRQRWDGFMIYALTNKKASQKKERKKERRKGCLLYETGTVPLGPQACSYLGF
jgi:uncharacterized protein with NRDE domain